jgi:hypothetical protein
MSATERTQYMIERWSQHKLTRHAADPSGTLTAYYLKAPKHGRAQSCYLIFSVEGIVIMGDWCPKQNGVISCYGYSEGWFAGQLSRSYIAEKFLQKSWQPEQGYEQLRQRILEGRRWDSITKEAARDAFDALLAEESSHLSADRAYKIFSDAGLSDFEDIGHGYDPVDVDLLQAIQIRFAQCKAEQATPAVAA